MMDNIEDVVNEVLSSIEDEKKSYFDKNKVKTVLSDILVNIAAPLLPGGVVDYYFAEADSWEKLWKIGLTRAAINALTGGFYGRWREKVFTVTETSNYDGRIKKSVTDIIAHNSFHVPFYQTVLAIGTYFSKDGFDYEIVANGTLFLTSWSVFLGPALGVLMDKSRKELFKVKTASEEANNQKQY